MLTVEMVEALSQFGVAGLMGVLWVWERLLSRGRERQLNRAHDRLMEDREQLAVLIKLVHRNTQAIERFARVQERLTVVLGREQEGGGVQKRSA